MKTCEKCHIEFGDDLNFCVNCGQGLIDKEKLAPKQSQELETDSFEEMYSKNKELVIGIIIFIIVFVLILVGIFSSGDIKNGSYSLDVPTQKNDTPSVLNDATVDTKIDIKVQATTVQVSKFYNGEDGYSLSIPTGNRSTCVWTWEGGSGAIPDSATTYAETATEKHTHTYYGESNYKVNCFDDFGNQYVGIFPTE